MKAGDGTKEKKPKDQEDRIKLLRMSSALNLDLRHPASPLTPPILKASLCQRFQYSTSLSPLSSALLDHNTIWRYLNCYFTATLLVTKYQWSTGSLNPDKNSIGKRPQYPTAWSIPEHYFSNIKTNKKSFMNWEYQNPNWELDSIFSHGFGKGIQPCRILFSLQ